MDLRRFRRRDYAKLDSGEPLPIEKARKVKKGREVLPEVYEIDRIITTKKCPDEGLLYLVQWRDYPSYDCTWEPAEHIPQSDIQDFNNPTPSLDILKVYANLLEEAIQSRLGNRNNRTTLTFPRDIFTYVFSDVVNFEEVNRSAFDKLPLSSHWYFKLNYHAQGIKLDFPVQVTHKVYQKAVFVPTISGSVKKFIPVEKLIIKSSATVCSYTTL